MERERLTRLLEDPGKVAREDLGGLRDLAERHPWFSGAHLLLATGEHAAGDVQYDDTLNQASAHLPSRAVLFDATRTLLTPTTPPMKVVRESQNEAPSPRAEVPEITAPLALDEPVDGGLVVDPLDAEIRRAALASSYELLLEHGAGQEAPTAQDAGHAAPELVLPVVTRIEAEGQAEQGPTVATHRSPRGRMRFTEWLDAPPASMELSGKGIVVPFEAAPARSAPRAEAMPPPAMDTGSLIDRFIQQTTPEPRPKAEFFTPQQAAKRSLDDTAGIVTETLARIYAKQGNSAKAIDAYRKLALKYPDKSAYFAALAKELEQQ